MLQVSQNQQMLPEFLLSSESERCCDTFLSSSLKELERVLGVPLKRRRKSRLATWMSARSFGAKVPVTSPGSVADC